jgi:hypothetical protein
LRSGAEWWGRGLFLDAAKQVLEFAFNGLGVERLEARVAAGNARGHRAVEKLGAVAEGLLRQSLLVAGWHASRPGALVVAGRRVAPRTRGRGGGTVMGALTTRRVVAVCATLACSRCSRSRRLPRAGARRWIAASPRAWARPARRASSSAVRAARIWPAAFAPPARGSARSCRSSTPTSPTSPTISSKRSRSIRASPGVHLDRPVAALLAAGSKRKGNGNASAAQGQFDGSGVGVAIIDSGVTPWHDDLAQKVNNGRGPMGQRVMNFVDFVDGASSPHDGYGHGTHVAGIIAGNGWDADGSYTGVAPGADLLVLRVLDAEGHGNVSDVIRALDFAVANRARYHLRVINLSLGAAPLESYETDPLTIAAQHAVEAGLVVVAAAGNLGKDADGNPQYGGITAPGNSPWVLTVGRLQHDVDA